MRDEPSVIKLVCVLGDIRAVAPDGGIVEIPSASQRRLLGLLALYAPQRLRTEWLADVLGISPGALRRSVSRLRTVLGPDALVTATTGYALTCPVDAVLFCDEVARAGNATDRIATGRAGTCTRKNVVSSTATSAFACNTPATVGEQ